MNNMQDNFSIGLDVSFEEYVYNQDNIAFKQEWESNGKPIFYYYNEDTEESGCIYLNDLPQAPSLLDYAESILYWDVIAMVLVYMKHNILIKSYALNGRELVAYSPGIEKVRR